jgi:hypothetical protein
MAICRLATSHNQTDQAVFGLHFCRTDALGLSVYSCDPQKANSLIKDHI